MSEMDKDRGAARLPDPAAQLAWSMFTLFLAFLGTVVFAGCDAKSAPSQPALRQPDQIPRAEVRVGGSDEDVAGRLPFKIVAVSEKQKLLKDFPFHGGGGSWLFFDCEAEMDAKVAFTIGVMTKQAPGGVPSAWGRAALIVRDQVAGGKFLELFNKSFKGKMPAVVQRSYSPRPLLINTTILGQGQSREAGGGFSGEAGSWTATKWFPEDDGRSAEVFFNYDIANRQGEFSEKDSDYADDLMAIWASALRDGPKPERTPANDPNLTLIGPTIGPPRKLLRRLAYYYSFSSTGRFAVYVDGSKVLALQVDAPNQRPLEIARFDNSPWGIQLLNDNLDLIVQEGVPETPDIKSSSDPVRIWLIDQKRKEKKLLRGPERDLELAEAAVSPDLRFVAFQQWRDKPKKTDGRYEVVVILDRQSGAQKTFEVPGKSLSLVRWNQTDAGLRAVVVTNRWKINQNESSESYLADPATGKLERKADDDGQIEFAGKMSPDKMHRVQVGKDRLVLTDVATGKQRSFVFHEDDRQFIGEEAIEWVSPRYLKFNGQRLALIDVTTMKMCFPKCSDGFRLSSSSYKFSPDFRWVLYGGETTDSDGNERDGFFIAPVEMAQGQ